MEYSSLLQGIENLQISDSESKELNILILGETGVGKSTWINGFINFLTYTTLEEAEESEAVNLIPSQFTVCDENFEEILVTTGSDTNEVHETGQAATQQARMYPITVGPLTIRLIDTPGVGDTRGVEQDKQNFQNILNTLEHLEELHGICILLKPNNARLNLMFRFCIKELLTYLHRDAAKNIVFCFTNSRSTFYRPGDTLPPLKKLLSENKDVPIATNKDTIYCYDSEAYRFLAAVKNDPPVQFSKDERDNFAKSWEKSIAETLRMVDYINSLPPHRIKSTLNLNHSRELVLNLTRPLVEISKNIDINTAIVEDEKQEIERRNMTIKEYQSKLMASRMDIQVMEIDHPKTVCGHSTCVETRSINGIQGTHYVQVCHPHCGLTNTQKEVLGDPELIGCWAMERDGSGNCRICGHSYRQHLHVYYDSIPVEVQVQDESVAEALKQNLSKAETKKKILEAKERLIQEYKDESKEIQRASVKFAYFLKTNAITPYNDEMEKYLNHMIRQEEDKVALGGRRDMLNSLEERKRSYLHERNILDQNMSVDAGITTVTPDEIQNIVTTLKALKYSGKILTDSLDCINKVNFTIFSDKVEKTFVHPKSRPRPLTTTSPRADRNQNWGFRKVAVAVNYFNRLFY